MRNIIILSLAMAIGAGVGGATEYIWKDTNFRFVNPDASDTLLEIRRVIFFEISHDNDTLPCYLGGDTSAYRFDYLHDDSGYTYYMNKIDSLYLYDSEDTSIVIIHGEKGTLSEMEEKYGYSHILVSDSLNQYWIILSYHSTGCIVQLSPEMGFGFMLIDTHSDQSFKWSWSPTVQYLDSADIDYWRIREIPQKPQSFSLSAYPNPFNSAVSINLKYGSESLQALSTSPPAGVEIFDINGRIVYETLVEAGLKSARVSGGSETLPYGITWQPDKSLGSGVYLVRAKVGSGPAGESVTKRVVYLK